VDVHHIALAVLDCERSARFYRDLLGLAEVQRQTDDAGIKSIWLEAGDAVLMLERSLRGRAGAGGSGHLLCFAASDLGPWQVLLAEAGIPVDDRTPNTIYVCDPDGHRVGLSVYRF
jgi:catechol 2,3-dioxygenase-like lactoylglutathione lyase family enzyme